MEGQEITEVQPSQGGQESHASQASPAEPSVREQAKALPSESELADRKAKGPQPAATVQTQAQPLQDEREAAFEKKLAERDKLWNERLAKELGQFRRLPNELKTLQEKLAAAQQQKPGALDAIDPAQRQHLTDLVDAIWKEKYGKDWDDIRSDRETTQRERHISNLENTARGMSNDEEWPKLNPILGKLYTQIRNDATQGNEQAAAFLKQLDEDKSGMGVFTLVTLGRQQLSKTVDDKNVEALAKQRQVAAKVASGPKAASRPAPTTMSDDDIMKISDRKERLKALEARIPHESDR